MLKLNPSQVQTYILLFDLNTSYVEVKHNKSRYYIPPERYLNTSYVEVKLPSQVQICIRLSHLNTSYVEVKP